MGRKKRIKKKPVSGRTGNGLGILRAGVKETAAWNN
jgi:hypothetical protein